MATLLLLAVAAAAVAGCAAPRPAPVSERSPPGRVARLPPAPPTAAKPAPPSVPPEAVVAAPLRTPAGTVEAKSLGSAPAPLPVTPPDRMVTEPKGVRLPYSDQALAQLSKPEVVQPSRVDPRVEPKTDVRPESEMVRGPDELDWMWPTHGKVVGTFNDATTKGIVIAGKLGQPVLASAPGRVIFSGTGIRGFGKLIVIKHNNTYLSVYGHNNALIVKEGQTVSKGQKIAEMGNTDADQVKLHFEIRRLGKPVDPIKLLPPA